MKPSELKQLIKEEIVSILSENQDMRGIIDEFSKEFNTNPKFKATSNDKMVSLMKVFKERIKKLYQFLKEIDK